MTARMPGRLAAACAVVGCALLAGDAWIAVKGVVARARIATCTERALVDGGAHRPWPWADFHPRARLEVPSAGVERPVLSAATGAVLAFGLGHVAGTAPPGGSGWSVVGGHRDGAAAFLDRLAPGDVVRIRTHDGTSRWIVRRAFVVRADAPVRDPGPGDRLWLVTCWPVRGTTPSDRRLVVEATRDERAILAASARRSGGDSVADRGGRGARPRVGP